jgi:hypothetical protein
VDKEDSVSASLSERVERRVGRDAELEVGSGKGTFDGDGGGFLSLFPLLFS